MSELQFWRRVVPFPLLLPADLRQSPFPQAAAFPAADSPFSAPRQHAPNAVTGTARRSCQQDHQAGCRQNSNHAGKLCGAAHSVAPDRPIGFDVCTDFDGTSVVSAAIRRKSRKFTEVPKNNCNGADRAISGRPAAETAAAGFSVATSRRVVRRSAADASALCGTHHVPDIKRAEFSVFGGGTVKPHRIDDVLDVFRRTAPQRDSPLPVIKAGRCGDQL